MEPVSKRAKLNVGPVSFDDWTRWQCNLEKMQDNLLSECLCHVEILEVQRPLILLDEASVNGYCETLSIDKRFLEDYTLQFISSIKLLADLALKQQSKGLMCRKVMDYASSVAMDEGIWEMLISFLDSKNRFITQASSNCLVCLLMWTKLPNLKEIFDELFNSAMITTDNPFKLSLILEVIRGVVEYKDIEVHPLDANSELSAYFNDGACRSCDKVEVDTEVDFEVKTLCVKALENWWSRLLTKFYSVMQTFREEDEAPVSTFLSLWLSIISIKNNLSVIDTKLFYFQLESFVYILSNRLPGSLWKKQIDVFNEILCYGSTLSLQDVPNDEPCDLAHLIVRCVKNRQFLQNVPFSKTFLGFGGSKKGPVDWQWESDGGFYASYYSTAQPLMLARRQTALLSQAVETSSGMLPLRAPSEPSSSFASRGNTKAGKVPIANITMSIGPDPHAIQATEEELSKELGDKPLIQKVVLIVLKSVAVTIKETRCDSDSDCSMASDGSESESDTNDMIIIEKCIKEVFNQVDSFVKCLQPIEPRIEFGTWLVKLFSDQDDALIESMLCTLDTYTGFLGRIQPEAFEYYKCIHPINIFLAFMDNVSSDRDILIDFLMGNETCFLLYLLRFLKFLYKSWEEGVAQFSNQIDRLMSLLIELRLAISKLVEKSLFPYNINPVVRLLEKCEQLYMNG